ncbi:sugar kinase, partial [Pseudomonas syringae pv. actinidiae]|nr:sugar kinase [Pseudomonas syringae pv. actinidiae]
LASYDVLYFSGITLAVLGEQGRARLLEALGRARLRGVRVAFDTTTARGCGPVSSRPREAYQACLPHVDLALLTEDDEQALYGYADSEELLAAYRDRGIGETVVKRGAQSCLIEAGGERFEVAPLKVEHVVDTTAAGDSFSAAYLAARLMGERPQQLLSGHRLAAVVIQHPGALIENPSCRLICTCQSACS